MLDPGVNFHRIIDCEKYKVLIVFYGSISLLDWAIGNWSSRRLNRPHPLLTGGLKPTTGSPSCYPQRLTTSLRLGLIGTTRPNGSPGPPVGVAEISRVGIVR
jgi:hypothetical protein